METFSDIIGKFGGPTKFAEAIDITGLHAQSMKGRDSIPPAYWTSMVEAASERGIEGVTLSKLAQIAKAKLQEKKQLKEGAQ